MKCEVDDCGRTDVVGHGYCRKHYQRWWKTGTTDLVRTTIEQRFWSKVERGAPDDCWPWAEGLTAGGYGKFSGPRGATMLAHRYGYELVVGPIGEGLNLDHLCHTRVRESCTDVAVCPHRKCVNPRHLEPVTMGDNLQRGNTFQRANSEKTHCPADHEFDEANTQVNPRGERQCRACRREQARASRARKKAALAAVSKPS